VVVVCALFLKAPPAGWLPHAWKEAPKGEEVKKRQSGIEFTSFQMAATSQFWVMYFMMTLVATGGLMATAQLNPMAVDFKVDKVPIHFLWLTLPALQFALSADRVLNGICRPIWGWISDHIGRENSMFIAFGLQGFAILWLLSVLNKPVAFIIASGAAFFFWGEMYSLFPAMVGDMWGRKYAGTNYGLMYTAKGVASIWAGPLAAYMFEVQKGWHTVFVISAIANFVAALAAILVLKRIPLRKPMITGQMAHALGGE